MSQRPGSWNCGSAATRMEYLLGRGLRRWWSAPGFVAGSACSGGRPAWTGVSLTPGSGVCELPTEAGAEHFIRLPPSWRQGLHDAPPAGTLKPSSLGAATRNFNIAC